MRADIIYIIYSYILFLYNLYYILYYILIIYFPSKNSVQYFSPFRKSNKHLREGFKRRKISLGQGKDWNLQQLPFGRFNRASVIVVSDTWLCNSKRCQERLSNALNFLQPRAWQPLSMDIQSKQSAFRTSVPRTLHVPLRSLNTVSKKALDDSAWH